MNPQKETIEIFTQVAEARIQTVLNGIRDSEPPTGMEIRVLQNLRDLATLNRTNPPRRITPWPLLGSLLPARHFSKPAFVGRHLNSYVIFALSALVGLAVLSNIRNNPLLHPAAVAQSAHKIPTPVTNRKTARNEAVSQRSPAQLPGLVRPALRAEGSYVVDTFRSSGPYHRAARESRAQNHPAPEAPLTEQEKLLLEIAHSGEPHELAMLNPNIRSPGVTKNDQDFQRFVGQFVRHETNPDR